MPDWINNPRYQRVIQRLQGMQPWQRAIFSSAGADTAFASEEMRNKINALNAATLKETREAAFDIGRRRLDMSRRLMRKGQKDERLAELIGVGNIGVSGILGKKELELANLQAAKTLADRRKILRALEGLS